ncbi:helix-turn-helix domain-containing protein [Plantactinospora soyae]|uniref:Transcriptional regulator with XRE-family HTH domain n=1 Tax=Plantactinospora soyae TaxID=1544732 RepID=A0A927QXC5_9ACTN|nr:helix-turn-helix transcriptional regulator [Plantactinospora soyae]MBE1486557.1 transcriptional regulator with XRE-family HTH domain [Plantactinospora soyae]
MSDLRQILRRLRSAKKMTQDQTGAAINVSGSLIAAIESGRLVPQPDTAERLDAFFGTGDEIQRAADAVREDAQAPWLRPWTENERRAVLLRAFQPNLIPGLLQTEAYTRAVLSGGRLPDEAVERTTQVRKERQAATVDRPEPPMVTAVLGESVLRCGPPEVMKDQLEHLVDIGHRNRVQVLVVPRTAGLHIGMSGPFVLAALPGGVRAGYLDDQLRGRVVTDPAELTGLELAWEIVTGLALPVDQSRDLIVKAVEEHG